MERWRQWLKNVLQRMRPETGEDSDTGLRSAQGRRHFWEEFRAGQRVADERVVAAADRPEPVTR